MNKTELAHMPKALRILADQIQAPDHVPAMCLRDAAVMIESLVYSIRATLRENAHLADGDKCTLRKLKDALGLDPFESVMD